ncbi:MAG: aminoacyl-tRNA hydrolase [Burkholderiales bacterium]|jgi:PTH1 family peptidyl-tRNA hydrolase|uniref:aminoacyl-tRNA hydrolase n=1 Tax=Limnobacter sp. TaxID=2003368 RepID=UPI0039BD00AE|nr:aminoacyl-tRNA hydrolase [Burkholderiales bacterium]
MSSNTPVKLIVGLGNPGPQYADTRHNAGVWYLEALARKHNVFLQSDKRFFGDLARIKFAGEDIWLLFPTTFMNRSGQAVGALAKFFKIKPEEILVAHDELDLLPGQIKIKKGGGHAGHNGLKDIHAHLGSNEFWRARIGIGHPRSLNLQQGVADFVLHRPSNEQQQTIDKSIDVLLKHTELILKGQIGQATTHIHTECA